MISMVLIIGYIGYMLGLGADDGDIDNDFRVR